MSALTARRPFALPHLPPGARRLGLEVFHTVGARLDHLESRDTRRAKNPGFVAIIRQRLSLRRGRT